MNAQDTQKATASAAGGGKLADLLESDYLTIDDLDHLVSKEPYLSKHIVGVAECVLKKHKWDFATQFGVALSSDKLEEFLRMPELPNVKELPVIVAYRKADEQWVTFCITYSENRVTVLYKDSLGKSIPKEIAEPLGRCYEGASATVHLDKEQEDRGSCGLLALKNMELIIEGLAKDKEGMIGDFANVMFCSGRGVDEIKEDFRESVRVNIHQTCIKLTEDIAENQDFKKEVETLVNSCVDCISLLEKIHEYSITMRSAGNREAVNSEHDVNEGDLEKMEKEIMDHEQTKLWIGQPLAIKQCDDNSQRTCDAGDGRVFFETVLQAKYSQETQKLTKVFKLLGAFKDESYSQQEIDLRKFVSKTLEINDENIKLLRQRLTTGSVEISIKEEPKEVVKPIDIELIDKELDEKVSLVDDSKVKAIQQILEEMASETKEVEEFGNDMYKDSGDILKLEKKYKKVKKHYNDWKDKGVKDIKAWALSNKGNLGPNELCKAVAIMDRANRLVTGHFLRDTQILAVLASLNGGESQGKLCQIATGEGKTVIVSLIATIKVLQGKKVDVITSNGVLAEEGVDTRGKFFGVFGISVAHNNPDESYRRGPMKCYTADVVYGSMGSFQFDHLKDSFEGLETRGRRKFEFVILDEVDSLLLDNGGHVAKLAEPFPGFDSLKYVYIKIWQELVKAEREVVRECVDELEKKSKELKDKSEKGDGKEFQEELSDFTSDLFQRQDEKIMEKIKNSDPANIDLIPVHLRQFAREMVDVWIQNAIYAKHSCRENEQYVVRTLENAKEPKIVPVDYQGTGVTLKNTMWSNGLHQFVQLKHNLHLTSETLTSSLISNIGYVKLYNNNLFGLTGTLGSTAEQELLSSVYNVKHSKVPTFKRKVFKEICGKVVKDNLLKKVVVQDILEMISKKRSVLIICSTISDVLGLEKKIKKLKNIGTFSISIYLDEDNSEIVKKEIGPGEIVISTNIAGRGSDFRTSVELESNGGLHVLVCFLPVNQRVEDQAFGRTSRQGNKGTAQIVMRDSEMLGLGFEAGQRLPFSEIKGLRDQLEAERLEQIRKVELAEIDFQDRIFGLFSKLYRKISMLEEKQSSALYLLLDLKEFWAFWLHGKQKEKISLAKVDEEFEKFKHEARHILGEEREDTFVGGSITHNPYYSIQQAEHYLQNNRFFSAEESLNHAIRFCIPEDSDVSADSYVNADIIANADSALLLYPAYIKLFEVHIEQGQAVMNSFLNLIGEHLQFGKDLSIDEGDNYKKEAKDALEQAKKGLNSEIQYIKENFTGFNDDSVVTVNQDFLNMLETGSVNLLWDHIRSRLTILMTILEHINSLLETVDASILEGTAISLSSKVSGYWDANDLNPDQQGLGNLIGVDELRELSLQGLGTMYSLKTVPTNFDISLIIPGVSKITAGVAAFATGLAFPPSFPIMAKISESFIVDGCGDLVTVIATLKPPVFSIKKALVSFGVLAISFGVFALYRYTQIAQRTINVLQGMRTYLEKCPALIGLCEYLVPVITEVICRLQDVLMERNREETVRCTLKVVGTGTASVLKRLVGEQITDRMVELLRPDIVENITSIVCSEIKGAALQSVNQEEVLEHLSEVFNETFYFVLKDVAKMFDASDLRESILSTTSSYTEQVCSRIIIRLVSLSKEGQDCENSNADVDGNCKAVTDMVAGYMSQQLQKQLRKVVSSVDVVKLLQNMYGQGMLPPTDI